MYTLYTDMPETHYHQCKRANIVEDGYNADLELMGIAVMRGTKQQIWDLLCTKYARYIATADVYYASGDFKIVTIVHK